MLKKGYRIAVAYLIAAVSVFAAFALGCGAGGEDGRQILPGENPFGPTYTNTGTGTGTATYTNTNTNTGTSTSTGTGTYTNRTPAENLSSGETSIKQGNTTAAIQAYTAVISNNNATHDQKQEAFSGLGWATAKEKSSSEASVVTDFQKAISEASLAGATDYGTSEKDVILRESKLGYALSIIQCYVAFRSTDLNVAIGILEDLLTHEGNANQPWVGYVVRADYASVYVSAPGARAMLALAYDLNGEPDKAQQNIDAAFAAAPNDDNVKEAKKTIDMLHAN